MELSIAANVDQLLLVPTELEVAPIRTQLELDASIRVELCGCGPFLAAARTMQLVNEFRPASVVLIGIAGGLEREPFLAEQDAGVAEKGIAAAENGAARERTGPTIAEQLAANWPDATTRGPLLVGDAYEFTEVTCFGLGAGSGQQYRSAWELNWQQWPAPPDLQLRERILLNSPASVPSRLLLTCSTASGDSSDVDQRLLRIPQAVAEDMEGYSVALACGLAKVPLRIIRGISNRAGDRQHGRWRVAEALQAAVDLWKGSR